MITISFGAIIDCCLIIIVYSVSIIGVIAVIFYHSFVLSSFALMFRFFIITICSFPLHFRHACFLSRVFSDVTDQKHPDHEADTADRELPPLCRCPVGGCGPRLCP